MRKRVALAMAAGLVMVLAAALIPAGAAGGASSFNAKDYKKSHGYLPLKGVETLRQAKAHSAEQVQNGDVPPVRTTPIPGSPTAPNAPTVGAAWKGVASTNLTPPDANGAIGPNSYIETVNVKMGIYSRAGAAIATGNLTALHAGNPTDPMILWDPNTQRFYYNFLNINNARMDWGFSKDANPTTIPGSFCNYETDFGYPSTSVPDYPKLGQTKEFLLIGINFYPTFSSQAATSADVMWIRKPQGTGAVTTCPAANTFGTGKVAGLLNENGTQTFTPTPAIQTDPSSTGYVMSLSDIECPPICGTGTLLTVFTVTPTGNPPTPVFSAPNSLTVGTYQSPADAQQPGTGNLLDTLDGRITHAVSGIDPRFGTTTVWTAHTVLAPAGAGIRWYEVDPSGAGSVVQNGIVAGASADIFNAGISNDRTCTATACAHGSAMVLGFSASSASLLETIAMVSKVGAGAMSGAVILKQSSTFDRNFSCSPCRWGDYGGATPDPAASMAAPTGMVWLSQQYTKGGSFSSSGDLTWNWQATP